MIVTKSKNKPEISFIMPAYNAEKFISDSITEIQKENKIDWELIIIDDFSEDGTLKVVKSLKKNDKRIKLFRNIKKGKITALNYGFTISKGEIIKLIDSDDVLSKDYFKFLNKLKTYQAHCHNMYITNRKLGIISTYNIDTLMIFASYNYILKRLITFPKAVWSFKREIAKKIFPMPESLPFEDVWINLIIKKNSKKIYYIDKPIYKYRQHDNQTFGGILNFDKKKVIFRAKRMLNLIKILKKEPRITSITKKNPFKNITIFYQMMASKKLSITGILTAKKINFDKKLKLLIFKKMPELARYFLYIKWKIDEIKNRQFK